MLQKKNSFGFNHSDQQDDLYTSMSTSEIKEAFDSRGEELKQHTNDIVDALKSTAEGDSGADNIGASAIAGVTGTTVQAQTKNLKQQIDDLVTKTNGMEQFEESLFNENQDRQTEIQQANSRIDATNQNITSLQNNKADKTQITTLQNQVDALVVDGDSSPAIAQALAGTQYTTLKQKLDAVDVDLADIAINVKTFGAKGDGITNDSIAFQKANDYLAANGGGILLVPKGTFIANFIIDSNITIKGNGVNVSIIKSAPGSNLDVIKGRDFESFTGTTADVTTEGVRFISVQDITIDGNKANNTSGYGIRLWGCFWYFDNVVVQFCKNDGIWTEFTSILSPTEQTARTAALESMFRNIKVLYCNGNAWSFNGPHDSIIDNYVAIGNLGWALYQRNFNSFLTGENWNVWKNGNGFHVGTGIAGHSLIADNDGTGIGMEFESNTGNSRIVNSRLSGWDKGMILKGQSHNIKMNIQNCGLNSNGSAIQVEGLSLTHIEIIAINNNCVLDMVSEVSKNSFVVTASVPSGKVLQRGVNIRGDSFAQLNSGGTGLTQFAENSLKVKGWTFTFPQNNGEILTNQTAPTTTTRGGVKMQAATADLTATPTTADFNGLLAKLRSAGVISTQ